MNNTDNSAPLKPSRKTIIIAAGTILIVVLIAGVFYFSTPHAPPLPCDASTLQIGATRLRIQTLAHSAGAPLNVPSGKPNVALWVQGTNAHYVFALSPTAQNLTLNERIAVGDPVTIKWADCSSDAYAVTSLEKAVANTATLLDQSKTGVTVFLPAASGSSGWTIEGQRPELLSSAQTPQPTDANATQAEISMLDQSVSADGKTLTLKVSIKNTGSRPIHLSTNDISLAPDNGSTVAPTSIDPALPLDIQSGASQAVTLTFAKPAGNSGILNLLTFTLPLYY